MPANQQMEALERPIDAAFASTSSGLSRIGTWWCGS